jgi:hypothetical protein
MYPMRVYYLWYPNSFFGRIRLGLCGARGCPYFDCDRIDRNPDGTLRLIRTDETECRVILPFQFQEVRVFGGIEQMEKSYGIMPMIAMMMPPAQPPNSADSEEAHRGFC